MEQISQKPKQIFILSGQSNMAGPGGVIRHPHQHHRHWDGVVPPECQPHPDILRLTAELHWVEAHDPLHADIDTKKACGVGSGMPFANAVRERVGVIGLVPCAVGGTAIKEWARGEVLYDTMVKRAKESVKEGGEIKGLLWYQGESDTSSEHDADAYQGNMEKLIHNVREDLALPSLPIIQVAIASGDDKYLEKVREAQLSINIPNVVCVDAKGLPLKDDNLHLTTQSQVKLGQFLAEAYNQHFLQSYKFVCLLSLSLSLSCLYCMWYLNSYPHFLFLRKIRSIWIYRYAFELPMGSKAFQEMTQLLAADISSFSILISILF